MRGALRRCCKHRQHELDDADRPCPGAYSAHFLAITSNTVSLQARRALTALHAHLSRAAASSADLLADSAVPVYVILGLKTILEKASLKPIKLAVPHGINKGSVCLITKDPASEFEALLEEKGCAKLVERVYAISDLRKEHVPYEAKRALAASYDVFVADERVIPLLPPILGKAFFKKKKQPRSIDMTKEDLAAELSATISGTQLLISKGTTQSIRIGDTGHSVDQLIENLNAVLSVVKKVGGWENIQSVTVKSAESVGVPVWNSLPTAAAAIKAAPANEVEDKKGKKAVEAKKETPAKATKAAEPATASKKRKAPSDSEDQASDEEEEEEVKPPPKKKAAAATPAKALKEKTDSKTPKATPKPAKETPKPAPASAKSAPATAAKKAAKTPAPEKDTPVKAKATPAKAKATPAAKAAATPAAKTPAAKAATGKTPKSSKK